MSDDPTLGGDPGYTPVRTSLPQILAEQANDAISKGADPKAVTARLGQMVAHLKAHPELDQMGMDAIGKGADPGAVTGRVWQMAQAEPGHGGGSSWGGPEDTPKNYSTGEPAQAGVVQAALNGVPFATKGMAVIDALRGRRPGQSIGQAYDQNIEARQGAIRQLHHEHPVGETVSEIGGAIAPLLATFGLSGAAEAPTAAKTLGMGAKMLRGGLTGAATGAIYGASNAHGGPDVYAGKMAQGAGLGAVGGAIAPPVVAAGKGVLSALGVSNLISKGAQAVSGRVPGATLLANALGTKGRASEEIGSALSADEASGAVRTPPPGVPSLAVDRGGPAVEGLAETIANSPGPARSQVTKTLEQRGDRMPLAVQGAIHEGTGVEPGAGLDPLRARIAERGRVAGQLYNAARETTKGQPVQSPTLDKVLESPIGQQAFKWAKVQIENRGMALPAGEVPDEATQQALRALGVPAEKASAAGVTAKELPDPETLHYMKRFLASAARLGLRDGQGGKLATEAQGALNQWGNIRGELPPIWRAADDAYAQHSKLIDLMDQGRNVYRAGINPAGRATRAAQNDVGAIGARIAGADAAGQEAGRQGVGIAMQVRALKLGGSVKSPGRLFSGPNAEATALGFKTPEEAASFQQLIKGWDDIAAQRERILGSSRTGIRRELADARKPADLTAASQALRGNIGAAVSRVVKGGARDVQQQRQQEVDAEIARRLMSSDPTALVEALKARNVRLGVRQGGGLLANALGGVAGSDQR